MKTDKNVKVKDGFYQFFNVFNIFIISHNKEEFGISMRKDITIERIMLGVSKMNKTKLDK